MKFKEWLRLVQWLHLPFIIDSFVLFYSSYKCLWKGSRYKVQCTSNKHHSFTLLSVALLTGCRVSRVAEKFCSCSKKWNSERKSVSVCMLKIHGPLVCTLEKAVCIFVQRTVILPATSAERLLHNQRDNVFGQLNAIGNPILALFSGKHCAALSRTSLGLSPHTHTGRWYF